MVDKFILFFIMSFLVVGCSQPSDKLNGSVAEMNNMSNDEKDAFDKQYLNDLKDIDISEKDFIYISRYIIELAKKNNFPEVDPILGKEGYMPTKDFTYPYSFYHYSNIPSYPHLEVVLKYRKLEEKLVSITIRPSGSQNDFVLKNSNMNILEALKLKLLKKEKFNYSNQLAEYQLTDGNFKYQVVAKNNGLEGDLPKEFYSFDIYIE